MKFVLKSRIWLSVALLSSVSGCATTPRIGGDPALQVATEMPVPRSTDIVKTSELYAVGPYDKLTIDVLGIPELSVKEVQVDANGSISFPLAGPINVSGMVSAQIEKIIAQRLRDNYVRKPQVTVNLIESVSHSITVDGKVKRPGIYPVAGGMTLMRSIALAEGVTNEARLNEVVVFRTVNNQQYAALYNLSAIRRGRYADPQIYANDIVMVGDAASTRLFKELLTAIPSILTPIVLLIQSQ